MNFDFLKDISNDDFWENDNCGQLYGACATAEANIYIDPYVALREERSALECIIKYYHKVKNNKYLDSSNKVQKDEGFQTSIKAAIEKEIRDKENRIKEEQKKNSQWKAKSEDEISSEMEFQYRKIDEKITSIVKKGDSGVHIHSVQNAQYEALKNLESLYEITVRLLNDLGLTNITPSFVSPEKVDSNLVGFENIDYTNASIVEISKDQYKLSFPDSEEYYIGNLNSGIPNGMGTFHYSDTSFYEGMWKNGLQDGQGKMVYEDGKIYDGEWKKGKRHGKGIFTSVHESTGERCIITAYFHEDFMDDDNGEVLFEDGSKHVGGLRGGKYDGKGTHYRADGSVEAKGQWLSGKAFGYFICYYPNGQISKKGNFVDGKWDGQRTDYYENGQIKFEGIYKTGKICGYGKKYYENGNIMEEGLFEDGLLNGDGKTYYEDGSLEYEGGFKNGERNGFGKKYNNDGIIIYEGNYKDGKADGEGKSFFDNGTLWHEGTRLGGYFDGHGKEYYKSGQLKYEGDFKNGNKEGYGILYNEAGWKEYEGCFENDLKNGLGKIYKENGWLLYNGKFVENMLTGYGINNGEDGDLFAGEFIDYEKKKGISYLHSDDSVYEGEFENGLKSGFGKVIYSDGRIREGYFKEGRFNGYIKFMCNGNSYDEYWYEGELLDEKKIESLDLDDVFFKVFKIETGLNTIRKKRYSFTTKDIIKNICKEIPLIVDSPDGKEFLYKRIGNIEKELDICLREYPNEALRSGDISLYALKDIIASAIDLLASKPRKRYFGWGPERNFYNASDFIACPTINSMVDNSEIGKEKFFVRIKNHNEKDFPNGTLEIVPGEKYDVRIYYNNNVSSGFDENYSCARGVRISTGFTHLFKRGEEAKVFATLMSENANPQCIWSQRYFTTSCEKVFFRYVQDSAAIHCAGTVDGTVISEELFTETGTLIGYDLLDGRLPGGEKHAGYIEYSLEAFDLSGAVNQLVSFDGVNYSSRIITPLNSSKMVFFRIIIQNIGSHALTNVCLKGILSNSLLLIPGSVTLTANESTKHDVLPDDLFGRGLNLGKVATGNTVYINYKCRINKDVSIPKALMSVAHLVYDSESESGDQSNKVTILLPSKLTGSQWGPERRTFTRDNPAPYVTFNSIIDNPILGDERSSFVRIREVNGMDSYQKEVEVFPDKVYEIYIYYNNGGASALPEVNETIAHDVRVRSLFPSFIKEEKRYCVTGTIYSENADPKEVWDSAYIISNENLLLKFVPNSIRLHSFSETDSQILDSDEFFGDIGALISAPKESSGVMDGTGYISYCIFAQKADNDKSENDLMKIKKAYHYSDDIKTPLFNSVIDHPKFGDEREFVHIRRNGGKWYRSVNVQPGCQYEIELFVRNDALPQYNGKENKNCGVACQTKVAINLPNIVESVGAIRVRISAENVNDVAEDEINVYNYNGENLGMVWVLGQARIYSNWKANEQVLPSWLFKYPEGTYIGLNKLNGLIPGGDDYICQIRFFVNVVKMNGIADDLSKQ